MKKGILAILILLVMSVSVFFVGQEQAAYAETFEFEQKSISTATLADSFADNSVTIVLNKEATMSLKQYTPDDFAGLDVVEVEDLTQNATELVRMQLAAEKTGNWKGLEEHIKWNMLIDLTTFRRVLNITLAENDKENVLSAVRQIEQRNDVLSAEPIYIAEDEDVLVDTELDFGMQIGENSGASTTSSTTLEIENFQRIQVEEAWRITQGRADVLVGIIDSGIDATHPDFVGRVSAAWSRDFSTNVVGGVAGNALSDTTNGHGS